MAQIQAGQYLHTPGIQPLQVTEGKLHTKAPDLETLVSALATDSRLELVRSLLAALEGKAATETTLAAAKAALDAISGKIATEASLAQTVQKLTALLERLDQKLTVEGEVQLKGSLVTHLVTNVNLGTLTAGSTTWIYTSTAPTIPFRLLRGYAYSSTAVKIELILQLHRNATFSGSELLTVVFNNAATSPWVVAGETDVLLSRFWRVGIRNAGEVDASIISNGLYGVI